MIKKSPFALTGCPQGPEGVFLTRRHAPPWSISASRHRPSGWRSRLLATASCQSRPGERTDHNHLQPLRPVSASAHIRILPTTTQASKWATVDGNTKPNLVVSAPAGVQLPRRLADQLLGEEELKRQQCVPKKVGWKPTTEGSCCTIRIFYLTELTAHLMSRICVHF